MAAIDLKNRTHLMWVVVVVVFTLIFTIWIVTINRGRQVLDKNPQDKAVTYR